MFQCLKKKINTISVELQIVSTESEEVLEVRLDSESSIVSIGRSVQLFSHICTQLKLISLPEQLELLSLLLTSGKVKGLLISSGKEPNFKLNILYDPQWRNKFTSRKYFVQKEFEALLSIITGLKKFIYDEKFTLDPLNHHYLDLASQLAIPFLPSNEKPDRIYGLGYIKVMDGHLISLNMEAYNVPSQHFKFIQIDSLGSDDDWWRFVPRLDTFFTEIESFHFLEELVLKKNELTELPSNLKMLTRLKRLDLSYNNIKHFPNEICYLSSLKEINLSENSLVSLPNEITELYNLEILNLKGNCIVDLPENILRFLESFEEGRGERSWCSYDHDIIHLDHPIKEKKVLADIGITNNPEEFIKVENSHIVELHISDSEIKMIPPSIKDLKFVRVIDASRNYLTEIPPELGKLVHLEELDLSINRLSTIPETIGNLTKLKKLDMSQIG